MDGEYSAEDHERALRAGRQAMANIAADHERAVRAGQQAMAKMAPKVAKARGKHPGWRFLAGWLALTQVIATGVATVRLFHGVTMPASDAAWLIGWPLAVRPHWVAAAAAYFAAVGLIKIWQRLGGTVEAATPPA